MDMGLLEINDIFLCQTVPIHIATFGDIYFGASILDVWRIMPLCLFI